ncbi:MAG: hypothetical protein ACYC8T_37995 [Myxococcaceae bacterium]
MWKTETVTLLLPPGTLISAKPLAVVVSTVPSVAPVVGTEASTEAPTIGRPESSSTASTATLPAAMVPGITITLAVQLMLPMVALAPSTAPAVPAAATVNSCEAALPLPVRGPPAVAVQAMPVFTTTGALAASQAETQNFTFEPPRTTARSGVIWHEATVLAAGASTQAPLRQT